VDFGTGTKHSYSHRFGMKILILRANYFKCIKEYLNSKSRSTVAENR